MLAVSIQDTIFDVAIRKNTTLQVPLTESVPLDDASERTLTETLPAHAEELIRTHEAELSEIVDRLLRFEPLPFDPPPS